MEAVERCMEALRLALMDADEEVKRRFTALELALQEYREKHPSLREYLDRQERIQVLLDQEEEQERNRSPVEWE